MYAWIVRIPPTDGALEISRHGFSGSELKARWEEEAKVRGVVVGEAIGILVHQAPEAVGRDAIRAAVVETAEEDEVERDVRLWCCVR